MRRNYSIKLIKKSFSLPSIFNNENEDKILKKSLDDYENNEEDVVNNYEIKYKKIFNKNEKIKNNNNNNIKILIRKNKLNSRLNFKNPNFSFKILAKNQIIFDNINQSYINRKNESIEKTLKNLEKTNMKFKIKMPKIKISSLLKKNESQKYLKNYDLVKEFNKEFKNNLYLDEKVFISYYKHSNLNYPEGREQFSLNNFNENEIILFGGISSTKSDFIWKFNFENFSWKKIHFNCNFIRYAHESQIIENRYLFILGGKIKFNNNEDFCTIDIFDFIKNKNIKPDFLNSNSNFLRRKNFISEKINDSIIIHGGINEKNEISNEICILNSKFDNYNNKIYLYLNKPSFINSPFLFGHSSCLVLPSEIKNHPFLSINYIPEIKKIIMKIKYKGIYIFGGFDKNLNDYNNEIFVILLGKKLEIKKIETNGKKPKGRIFTSLNYYEKGNILILHGGRNEKNNCEDFNDTFVFSLKNFCWSEIKILNKNEIFKRCGHKGIIYNDELIIFGGINSYNFIGCNFFIINLIK